MSSPSHAAIILCGGHSRRMGFSKAWLPFGEETMLQRVVRIVRSVVDTTVVVAAADQSLPPLPSDVIRTQDAAPDRGPLQGLLAGLTALPPHIDAAFVTTCDVPLLSPAFIERMLEFAAGFEIAVPCEETFLHPLSAIYRPSVIPHIESLFAADRRRAMDLLDLVPTNKINAAELRDIDPTLASLHNLNTPADYFAAAASAGIVIPDDVRKQLSAGE